ncbi:uncharacterized protein [Dermacentor andersoni]|uniref:uncharacterized protein n=1 Tax=Dermacentor andersoni TaxID=34620 RepID=UPI003B3B4075
MPDTTYRMCGFTSGLNWRPVNFKQRLQTTRVCRLCGVVPQSIAVLPCTHFLCDSCLDGCASGDRHACPLDKISFEAESDISWITFHQKHMEKLQVSCWNAHSGCNFVGPAVELLEHFEKHCSFHATTCPGCRDTVLRKDLPRHYAAGCNGIASLQSGVAGSISSLGIAQPNAKDAGVREVAADCSCHDMLTSIQGRVNDLAETLAKLSSRQLEEEAIHTDPSTSRGAMRRPAGASVHDLTSLRGTADLRDLVSALNEMKVIVTQGFRKMERRVRTEDLQGGTSSTQRSCSQGAVTSRPAESLLATRSGLLQMAGSSGGHHDVQSSETSEELFVFSVQYKPWLVAEKSKGLKIVWHQIFAGGEDTGVCVRCVVQRNAGFVAVYAMSTMPARWKLPVVRPLRAEDLSSPHLREWIVEKAKEPSREFLPVSAYAPDLRLRCLLDASALAGKTNAEGEIRVDFLVILERRFAAT